MGTAPEANVRRAWGWMLCSPMLVSPAGSRAVGSTPRSLCVACSPCWDPSGCCGRREVLAQSLRRYGRSNSGRMTDIAAQLLHGFQTIAQRRPRPRPFIDIGPLPWDDPAFSRHFLRTATRSQRYTQREITFLEQCGLLHPGQRILDIACGGGRHSLAMARRGALVTGIDLGPLAIASAQLRG